MNGRNRTAIDEVIETLRQLGRLERIDAALVAAAQTLADAVDSAPDNASLWREYRAAEQELRGVGGEVDDEFTKTLAALRATVGDEKDSKPAKPRGKRGGGSGGSRPAADAVAEVRR